MLSQLLSLFGNPEWSLIEAHRASTHLSIGLLIGAVFFDLFALLIPRKREVWREMALWMQLLGTLLLALTFALGYFGNPFAGKHNEIAVKADWHFRFGLATLLLFTVLTLWRITRNARWHRAEAILYGAMMLLGVLLITLTGWMGGHLLD
jgi:uncharacterized membrane protein